jgi:cell wall-associated NlpC family hydrolase
MTRARRSPWRLLALAAGAVLLAPVVALGGVAAGLTQLPPDATPSSIARTDIPADLLALYQQAAHRCPGLPWPVLAGLGKVESDHNRPPRQVSPAGAQGPMQFLPATWATYGTDGNGDGTADAFDPADAIPAAAGYLCAHDASTNLREAVASYLCGALAGCLAAATAPAGYATRVLAWAARYADPTQPSGPAATVAVQAALGQLGVPYQWGGQTPGLGFDCSGLSQYAYGQAGLLLPRTAQAQYDAGPLLPHGAAAQPGDLVFFGTRPTSVTHVGLALGDGRMVDAPHTGAQVRVEPIAGFGPYLGATRPAAGAGG